MSRMFEGVAGGVERMATVLMNAMVERGHEVTLFTWDRAGARAFFPLDERIRWHRLDLGDPMRSAAASLRLRRMARFRRAVRADAPDVVLAFQHGAFLFAATSLLGAGVPTVLCERNAPDRLDHTKEGRHRAWLFHSMRAAAAITVQFDAYVSRYPAYLRHRIVVIPNPVTRADARATPGAERARRTLLAVGRLSYQKNFASLLRAFAAVAGRFPEWRLRIVGDGEESEALQSLARSLGVESRVRFEGSAHDVSAAYRDADLFCLPSRFEGFPNALAEAMAHGLPAVAFAGCSGMQELVTDGVDGRLAPGNDDAPALAETLAAMMSDPDARARMGTAALRIADRYRPEQVFEQWERLLRRVARSS